MWFGNVLKDLKIILLNFVNEWLNSIKINIMIHFIRILSRKNVLYFKSSIGPTVKNISTGLNNYQKKNGKLLLNYIDLFINCVVFGST